MNRIKELRKAKKITVKDLAEQLGIAQSMLTNYENGSSIPRDQSIWEKLSEYFEVSVSYLMGLTDTLNTTSMPEKHTTLKTITIDTERVRKDYIDGKQPIEVIMSSVEEYALLANMQMLRQDEIVSLLEIVQTWVRENHGDSCPVIVLPDSKSE